MWPRLVNLVFLAVLLLLAFNCAEATTDLFEESLLQLIRHRRMFLEGFGNGTMALERDLALDLTTGAEETDEGRGRKKRLRQMNRTLMAIIMAYTLKFMFLIPTFVGTLILLKFTTALAGFFYALFAAVLGLEHHQQH